ncbi:MAG: hypothetical protein ACI9QN_002359, partial [Arcticibacterium sp.]
MNLRNTVYLVILYLLVVSCSEDRLASEKALNKLSAEASLSTPYLEIAHQDSFSIGQDSEYIFYSIPEINPDMYRRNIQFGVSNADLIVGVTDTTGKFVKKITKRGNGPGQLIGARSIKGWVGNDGDYYVLTNSNLFSLYVFSSTGEFRYTVRLFKAIDNIYHPKMSNYHFSEKKDGKYTLTLGMGSTLYGRFQKEYYENSPLIAQYLIDDSNGKVISATTHLKYTGFKEVKSALEESKINWGANDAIFRKYKENYFLTFPFSKSIYILDGEFNQIDELEIKTFMGFDEGFSFKMQRTPKKLYDRTYLEFRAHLENISIENIQLIDNLLIIQYQPPLNEGDYLHRFPTENEVMNSGDWSPFFISVDQFWLIYDLKTGEERVI